jgi:ubiquinone biosynthesis protein UbiJ
VTDLDWGFIRAFDPAARAANRMLGSEAWSREHLAAHAGRIFTLTVGLVSARYRITAGGMIEALADTTAAPDLRLRVSPFAVPTLLADPSRFGALVEADGDAALAAAIRDVAQTIPWFVERTLSDALGPIIGQRIADAGRAALAFPESASARISESVARYVRDEARLAIGAEEARGFAKDVGELAATLDALTARVDALVAPAAVGPVHSSGTQGR